MDVSMKSNKLFLALFVQLAFLWSCGERKGSAIVPVKKDKPSESTPDNANLGEAQQQVGLGPCTRQTPRNCVPVDFGYSLVGTLGPMQGNNPGFIGEPKQPVHWQINVASKGDLTRELGVYKSGMDFYGYAVRYDSAGAIQQPQQINGSVQQISGMANTYSNIKIDWANPPTSEGKMVLVVRDITLCRARSKPGMEALCTEFNEPNELFERNIEIPFKVAKNIISESQKRGSIWGQLAACMVLGFGEIAGADRFNSEVLAGTIQGVTGNSGTGSAGCYTGNDYIPQQQGTYGTISDSSNAFASP